MSDWGGDPALDIVDWPDDDILTAEHPEQYSVVVPEHPHLRVLRGFEDAKEARKHAEAYGRATVQRIVDTPDPVLVLPHNGVVVPLGHVAVAADEMGVDLSQIPIIHAVRKNGHEELVIPEGLRGGHVILLDNGTDTIESSRRVLAAVGQSITVETEARMVMLNRHGNGRDISGDPWCKPLPPKHYLLSYGGFDRKMDVSPAEAAFERLSTQAVIANGNFPQSVAEINADPERYLAYQRDHCIYPLNHVVTQSTLVVEHSGDPRVAVATMSPPWPRRIVVRITNT